MSKYIIAVMGAIIAYLGICYFVHQNEITKLSGEVKTLAGERDLAMQAAEKNKLSLDAYIESCESTVGVLKAQMDKERTLSKAQEGTLEKLSKKPPIKAKPEVKDAEKDPTSASVFELDPEYVRLLNDAYCEGNGNDPYCSTGVAGDGVQQANQSGRK